MTNRGRGFKGYRYLGNQLMITTCKQPTGAKIFDYCYVGDADRNRYEGIAILMFPSRKNEYDEHESQRALVIAISNRRLAQWLDPHKYSGKWRVAKLRVGLMRSVGLIPYLTNPALRQITNAVVTTGEELMDSIPAIATMQSQADHEAAFTELMELLDVPLEQHDEWRMVAESPPDEPVALDQSVEPPRCQRCKRKPFCGRLHEMSPGQRVCIDCFSYLTGIDDRDPVEDRTARSGDPAYRPPRKL